MKTGKLMALLLAACVAISCTLGCGEPSVTGFELSHFDASNVENGYDTDLLYKNNSNLLGGDAGFIYVSEEQGGEEYGGYFYQYMSETQYAINRKIDGMSGSPCKEDGTPATSKDDADYIAHFIILRSKDLNDWKICGALNGMGLKLPAGEYQTIDGKKTWVNGTWLSGDFWAPECIYDTVSGKYYLYFNATQGNTRSGNMFAAVAVSDTPVGPFELVTSEHYKSAENPEGKNPNGEILTLTSPQWDFQKYYGENHLEFRSYIADLSPMIDDNGDLYLYFVRRTECNEDGTAKDGLSTWGIKMKDFATPDYSTISLVLMHEKSGESDFHPVRSIYKGTNDTGFTYGEGKTYESADGFINDSEYPRWDVDSWEHICEWEDGTKNTQYLTDGSVNPDYNGSSANQSGSVDIREGIQVIKHKDASGKTVYYATSTFTGVQSSSYDEHWGYSYSPLGNESYTYPKNTGKGTILGVDIETNDFMSNLGHASYLEVDGEWWIAHWEWTIPFSTASYADIGRIYACTQMTWITDESCEVPIPVGNGPSISLQAKPSVFTGYRNIAGDAKVSATNCDKETIKYLNDGHVITASTWQDREFVAKKNTTITFEFSEPKSIRSVLIYNSYNEDYAFKNIASIQFTLSEKPDCYDGSLMSCYIKDLGFNAEKYYPGSAAIATFDEIKVTKIQIVVNNSLSGGKELRISDIQILGK